MAERQTRARVAPRFRDLPASDGFGPLTFGAVPSGRICCLESLAFWRASVKKKPAHSKQQATLAANYGVHPAVPHGNLLP